MDGLILAAGQGSRLRPATDNLPKTLLPVSGTRSILDIAVANLASTRVNQIHIVTGFAAEKIEAEVPRLETEHGIHIVLIHNPKGMIWNNAYSLWVGLNEIADDVLIVNSDTVHPPTVEADLVAAAVDGGVFIAADYVKVLGEEEMKLLIEGDDRVVTVHKGISPHEAAAEYIGVSLVGAPSLPALRAALETTWRRDPGLYYEDGYQELIDTGGVVTAVDIGDVPWIEVDSPEDLELARRLLSHS